MPPKKRGAKSKAALEKTQPDETKTEDAPQEQATEEPAQNGTTSDEKPAEESKEEPPTVEEANSKEPINDEQSKPSVKPPKKRKQPTAKEEPCKGSRTSKRSTAKSAPSSDKLLSYLLSKDAQDLTRPDDEAEDVKSRGDIRTYSSSVLNPYEELLCAVILSRPISHRLGLRTIRTVLNAPYSFNSAKATKEAGHDKHIEAVYEAKTQHKEKTAAQIGTIADTVLAEFTSEDDKEGKQMKKVLQDTDEDMNAAYAALKKQIKGLGTTGLEIFFRRVQWLWPAVFPNVDGRTADALRMLGLPQDGQELVELLDQHWDMMEKGDLAGDDEASKKRRAFVVILERATGAQLEDKVDDVLAAAAA